jgi:hypothetical protein
MPWYPVSTCLVEAPPPDRVVIRDLTSACGEIRFAEAFAVVGQSTATTFYAESSTTGACEPASPLPQTVLRLLLGEALSPSVFPEVERTIRE